MLKKEVHKLAESNKCLLARLEALEKRMTLKESGCDSVEVLEWANNKMNSII